MSDPLPFCKIKLQYLLEMASDPDLDDNAFRIAAYLALRHADHETGGAYAAFSTIGKAIGKCAKSVKRALNKPALARYLTIERGTNIGNASRYIPTPEALTRATDCRREGDKIVPFSRSEGGHIRPQRETIMSAQGGRNCPPNLESEHRKEKRAGLQFVPSTSRGAQAWDELCQYQLSNRLVAVICEDRVDGVLGYWLPDLWPPLDRSLWPTVSQTLLGLSGTRPALKDQSTKYYDTVSPRSPPLEPSHQKTRPH